MIAAFNYRVTIKFLRYNFYFMYAICILTLNEKFNFNKITRLKLI